MSRFFRSKWGHKRGGSGSGGTRGSGHNSASSTKSYHNGGVEGDSFSRWYDAHLAGKVSDAKDHLDAVNGSGGTKGSGSGGTKGSDSGGTKGSGSGGTKGSGSGGTKGSGSGGTKGSGSGGTKGSGSGGTKGSGSGGTKGSGTGGTKGSGSGGTKGSGSGGTKGSGSGGTKGSGSGGTKGSGSGGTKGSVDTGGTDPVVDDGKVSASILLGDTQQFTVTATQTPQGTLFVTVQQTNFDNGPADIDGLFFNLDDNATLDGLTFFPDPLSPPVTGFTANADAVNALPSGATVPGSFDAVVQFGDAIGSTDGTISAANFTLSSSAGPLTLADLPLSDIGLLVNSTDGNQVFLTDGTLVDQPEDEAPVGEDDDAGDEDIGGTKGSGTGGTKGSGTGGTKGSGTGGTKGSGTGGTKGSGTGGTKGSGTGGTKGSGSGGTKGSGTGGTKGSGSGGTKGSGTGGTKGSGTGGTKGSGTGGTKGSGTGGTKGSGTGGTKGSGTGGTKGSGSGGTKGSGTGGTTGGYGQWSGVEASAAANTLPPFEAYPEDTTETGQASVHDIMSLMTQDVDCEEQNDNWGSATAGYDDAYTH